VNKVNRSIMWLALVTIGILAFLSVYGAFLGSQRAKEFFNSVPVAIYWVAFILLLIIGIALLRRLLRVPALLLIHVGCVLVLAGAIRGSEAGHKLCKKFFGFDKILTGQMIIYEGDSNNRVILEDNQQAEFPFHLALKDFRIEYYKPEQLYIQTRQGDNWVLPVEIGTEFSLGDDFGTIKILRVFENFKITIDGESRTLIDDPGPGSNPALKLQLKSPDGQTTTKYVFERFPGHTQSDDELLLSYRRIISDFVSELQVIRDGKVVAEKNIEVNHPLHYGGYHFYQHSYDSDEGRYTILLVMSDSGLYCVYTGYLMLCLGVIWHFWLRHIINRLKTKKEK
jgi:hypothetical protein